MRTLTAESGGTSRKVRLMKLLQGGDKAMCIQDILNSRARKELGYMTPKEKYELLTDKEFAAAALSA